jgi:hypothetical protein
MEVTEGRGTDEGREHGRAGRVASSRARRPHPGDGPKSGRTKRGESECGGAGGAGESDVRRSRAWNDAAAPDAQSISLSVKRSTLRYLSPKLYHIRKKFS